MPTSPVILIDMANLDWLQCQLLHGCVVWAFLQQRDLPAGELLVKPRYCPPLNQLRYHFVVCSLLAQVPVVPNPGASACLERAVHLLSEDQTTSLLPRQSGALICHWLQSS